MRTVLTRLFVLGVLVSAPFSVSAASINLDAWQVTATESSTHQLNLAVEYLGSDPQSITEDPVTLEVTAPQAETTEAVVTPTDAQPNDVLINEFVSDPIAGQEEWVELYNNTEQDISLVGWSLVDGSGKITLLDDSIASETFALIHQPKGALNNSGDLIQLYNANQVWIDGIAYGDWEEATAPMANDPFSVGRNASNLFVQMDPTPGEPNREPASDAVTESPDDVTIAATDDAQDDTQTQTETETNATYDNTQGDDQAASTTTTCTQTESSEVASDNTSAADPFVQLSNIRSYPSGTKLLTEGLVSVLPGVLGKQLFYLAGSGVQVFLYSAEFPLLERGTRVRVSGELSDIQGETRLKASQSSDIQILSQEDAPQPHDVNSSQIGEETEGWLVRLTGTVTEKSSGELMLADADGEIHVVVKPTTGIAITANVGDTLTVTGIVSQTTSGYRLLPRDQQDIVIRTNEDSVDPALAGTLGSSTGNGGTGFALSGAALVSMAGSAGVYYLRKRAAAKLVTA